MVVGALVTLLALFVKRHNTPTNYYLLIAFVSQPLYHYMHIL